MEEYVSFQRSAYVFAAFAGAVQYGGRRRGRQIFQRYGARLGRLNVHARHALYGLSHRAVQRRQRARGAVSRRAAGRERQRVRAHLAPAMHGGGRAHRGAVLFPRAPHADAAAHEG